LDGSADRASTAAYVGERLADYGPEELIHVGVQLLNDDLLASREGERPSHARLDAWRREVAEFDQDPVEWNRKWAFGYAERVLPGLKPAGQARWLHTVRDKLSAGDVEELKRRFEIA
jgi:hypothetical protein